MNLTPIGIYKAWSEFNSYRGFLIGTAITMVAMVVFGALDYVWFPHEIASHFSSARLLIIAGMSLSAGIVLAVDQDGRNRKSAQKLSQFLMLLAPIAINQSFIYFYAYAGSRGMPTGDILIGAITCALASYMIIGRFVIQMLGFFVLSIGLLFIEFYFLGDEFLTLDLFMAHILGVGISYGLNKKSAKEIFERYLNFKKITPVKCAYELAVTGRRMEEIEESMPRERFTAFLVCDWRSYQSLAQSIGPKEVSELFRDVYTLAFAKLPEISPELTYYTSWTADEHRVTFYSNKLSDDEVRLMAIRYAEFLRSELPLLIKNRLGFEIEYDIGLSSGYAFTGLQGPLDALQYTIAGDHPGTAKRLEGEAAYYRSQIKKLPQAASSIAPILSVSGEFQTVLKHAGLLSKFTPAKSKSKDTAGLDIFIDLGELPSETKLALTSNSQ